MSTLKVSSIRSNGNGFNDVVAFQNSSGTQNGTLCRAWVNFNGTGVVAIRQSFNVSSITDNGTGDYTVNFTNAMVDASYSAIGSSRIVFGSRVSVMAFSNHSTTSIRLYTATVNDLASDEDTNSVAIFR